MTYDVILPNETSKRTFFPLTDVTSMFHPSRVSFASCAADHPRCASSSPMERWRGWHFPTSNSCIWDDPTARHGMAGKSTTWTAFFWGNKNFLEGGAPHVMWTLVYKIPLTIIIPWQLVRYIYHKSKREIRVMFTNWTLSWGHHLVDMIDIFHCYVWLPESKLIYSYTMTICGLVMFSQHRDVGWKRLIDGR